MCVISLCVVCSALCGGVWLVVCPCMVCSAVCVCVCGYGVWVWVCVYVVFCFVCVPSKNSQRSCILCLIVHDLHSKISW